MKIALLNNRWFMVGGTTRYLFGIQAALERAGHTVIPFSNLYPETVDTPYKHYFVPPPGGDAVFFADRKLSPARAWSLFERGLWSREVKTAFGRLLDEEKIDLCYSVNICNFIGPSVIAAARERQIPFVMRLSDFNLLCPAYNFIRDGRPCEDCTGGLGLLNAVRHRCLQGSVAVSAARALTMQLQRQGGIYRQVQQMITPSSFLADKLRENGFASIPIDHLPTFVDLERFRTGAAPGSHRRIVFSGRISPEKGLGVLLEAWARLGPDHGLRLEILGDDRVPHAVELKQRAMELDLQGVEFHGFVDSSRVGALLDGALALALPSQCYENMPNAVTEAMASGIPVIGSRLGSLPEQIEDGVTGLLAEPADPSAWAAAIGRLAADSSLAASLGAAGRAKAEKEWTERRHLDGLLSIFARHTHRNSGRSSESL